MTTTTTDIDEVLARVATGELTPGQALDLLGPTEAEAEALDDPFLVRPTPGGDEPLKRIVLRTSARNIQISTDSSVAEVAIGGDHEMRRSGDSLVIENPSPLDDRPGHYSLVMSLARALPSLGSELTVRVNPALVIEGDLSAASIKVRGTPAALRLRILASALRIDEFVGSAEIDAVSSSIKGAMTMVGQNRIDCESSSCKLVLTGRSDVTVRAQNQMGKVILPTARSKGSITAADVTEAVIGKGRGSLAIDATMSSVMIGTTP